MFMFQTPAVYPSTVVRAEVSSSAGSSARRMAAASSSSMEGVAVTTIGLRQRRTAGEDARSQGNPLKVSNHT